MKSTLARTIAFASLIAGSALTFAGCGSGLSGTYTNPTGLVTLDVRSGGKASLAMMGESEDCTYDVDGKKMTLTCNKDKTVWNIHDDGSITGPGFVGTLSKKK
ncbi:MAG TPA: hypothetical protein VMJ13_01850 [Candidatus Acidoferrum sp.]|jgi:hypothetical protein|nr:hypothetical protein [Candidatus Acidoferrum sp.]